MSKLRKVLGAPSLPAASSGWIHFGVPGTEHIAGTTTLEVAMSFRYRRRALGLSIPSAVNRKIFAV
jgi:hypothetical protein